MPEQKTCGLETISHRWHEDTEAGLTLACRDCPAVWNPPAEVRPWALALGEARRGPPDYRLEAILASLDHQAERALRLEPNCVALPVSGTGTEGRFVLVGVDSLCMVMKAART